MECPNCNKPAKQKYKRVTVNYRGRKVRFSKLYYSCCVNFTTTEIDKINMASLIASYVRNKIDCKEARNYNKTTKSFWDLKMLNDRVEYLIKNQQKTNEPSNI